MAIPANVIDPHSIFANGENVDLTDLTMFAELKVTKRNRTANGAGTLSPITINFLGAGDSGLFTTDFTENKENFGITRIEYKMSSSYVPQVDIEFMDVRGQSLFNDNVNSKYRVIFDMPPPIFELTLKGYYGQSVTYRLHLLKQNVSVNENASFVVKSSFVGMTFAPLADILLDYLEVAPFLAGTATEDSVDTTLHLRTKAKDLVNEIKTATQKDVQYLQDKSSLLEDLKSFQGQDYVETFLANINGTHGESYGQNNQVLAGREKNKNIVSIGLKWFASTEEYAPKETYDILNTKMEEVRKFFSDAGIANNINIPTLVDYGSLPTINSTTDQYHKVCTIDFTNVNTLLNQNRDSHSKNIADMQEQTRNKVKTIAFREIQGGPTLSNVLRILLKDARLFVQQLKAVVNAAANNRKNNDGNSGESYKYPFPIFYTTKTIGGRLVKVRSLPTDESWDEVQFVNKYINAKNKAISYEKANSDGFDSTNGGVNTFVPLNPFDGALNGQKNIYSQAGISNIYGTIIERAAVLLNASLENNGGNGISNAAELVTAYAKLEAYNITSALKYNPQLLAALINDISQSTFDFTTKAVTSGSLFAANYRAGDSVDTITGATVNMTYKGGDMIMLKGKDDWASSGGVPIERKETSGTDAVTNAIQELVNGVEENWFKRKFTGDDKIIISQQNIPFFKDYNLKDSDGNFNNGTDYFSDGDGLFAFGGHINTNQYTDAQAFLKLVCTASKNGYIINPFDVDRFQKIAAIHEVPFFVLAWWGYQILHPTTISTDLAAKYATLPQKMRDILTDKYGEYLILFGSVTNKDTIVKYFKPLEFFTSSPDSDFYKTDFCLKFTESFYLVLGDTGTFYGTTDKTINFTKSAQQQKYFDTLKSELKSQRSDIDKQKRDEQKRIEASVRDNDIRTELYYSFKSFVDRWLLDSIAVDFEKMLDLDTFLTVDRGFNNIGADLIMDLEPLYSEQTSVDTSLYTLLLNLLSKNNMEFFSMPTYVNYKDGGQGVLWSTANVNKIFGTTQNINIDTNPKYICMYIGGTSAQLDMPKTLTDDATSHDNDGGDIGDIEDLSGNSAVQAFLVNIGTQNQSYFKTVDLDQAEFKETNESIKLLDNIAKSGDANNQTTETKSNNLFNVYQQRSYTATVHGMGNVMIQPTMYFQLDNIAMWRGAYLIIEVHHTITPNSMDTWFRGVRVPQFMKPYVNDYTIIANIDLGSPQSQNTAFGGASSVSGGRGISPKEVKEIKATLPHIGNNTNTRISAKEKALLDVISYTEGTLGQGQDGYDLLYTSKYIQAWNPDYKFGHGGQQWKETANGITSTAAGRYQFLYDTWRGYSTGDGTTQGDPKNKPFSKVNQDLTGVQLITEKRLRPNGLDIEKITHDNFINYIDVLALEWASFPFYGTIKATKGRSPSWTVGKGYYDGQGGRFTVDELWIVYSLALKKYTEGAKADLPNALNQLLATTVTPAQAAHIATLHPSVQAKFTDLVSQIQSQTGYIVNITDSYRTYAEAVRLKNQNSANATPGTSLHEYGLAMDVNLIKGSQQLLKASSTSDWTASGAVAIAKNLGFVWGGDAFGGYKDNVHFEIANNGQRYSGTSLLSQAQQLYGANISQSDLRKITLA